MFCTLKKASIWGQLFTAPLEGPVWAVTSHLDVPAAGLQSHLRLGMTIVHQEPTLSPTLGTDNPTLPLGLEKQSVGWFEGLFFILMYLGQVLLFNLHLQR